MRTPEEQFERELEIFRIESEKAAQFFYAYLAMHEVAKRHKEVYRRFNQHPLFWTTVLGGLQTAALIALGRVFDQKSPHNLDALLRFLHDHPAIFSKAGLAKRKQGTAPQAPSWLADYLRTTHELTNVDVRRIARLVRKYRRIYTQNYLAMRNQFYAHTQATEPAAIAALVAKTNIKEMERLFVFLLQLHQSLQELFANGRIKWTPLSRPFLAFNKLRSDEVGV